MMDSHQEPPFSFPMKLSGNKSNSRIEIKLKREVAWRFPGTRVRVFFPRCYSWMIFISSASTWFKVYTASVETFIFLLIIFFRSIPGHKRPVPGAGIQELFCLSVDVSYFLCCTRVRVSVLWDHQHLHDLAWSVSAHQSLLKKHDSAIQKLENLQRNEYALLSP